MSDTSRLDTAKQEVDAEAAWYRSPLVLAAAAVLFLGVLALIAIGFGGGDGTDDVATQGAASAPPIQFGGAGVPEVDSVVVVGDPLPGLVGPGEDQAPGMKAPVVTATSLANGNSITLGEGRARVIGFFAHWCPHCQDELPEVTQWLADNQLPPNTEFIAVSTRVDAESNNYPPSAWFTAEGFGAPVIVDDEESSLLLAYGFRGFPAFIAIDSSGTVIERAGGNIGTDGLADLFANFAS